MTVENMTYINFIDYKTLKLRPICHSELVVTLITYLLQQNASILEIKHQAEGLCNQI